MILILMGGCVYNVRCFHSLTEQHLRNYPKTYGTRYNNSYNTYYNSNDEEEEVIEADIDDVVITSNDNDTAMCEEDEEKYQRIKATYYRY